VLREAGSDGRMLWHRFHLALATRTTYSSVRHIRHQDGDGKVRTCSYSPLRKVRTCSQPPPCVHLVAQQLHRRCEADLHFDWMLG
jgi:hypothetical protein